MHEGFVDKFHRKMKSESDTRDRQVRMRGLGTRWDDLLVEEGVVGVQN